MYIYRVYNYYVHMHACMYLLYLCVYVCMYVCMYVRTYVCMNVCMYVCIRVCMYACMHVCRAMHVGIQACIYSVLPRPFLQGATPCPFLVTPCLF